MSIFKLIVGTLLGAVGGGLAWYLGSMALQGLPFITMVIVGAVIGALIGATGKAD